MWPWRVMAVTRGRETGTKRNVLGMLETKESVCKVGATRTRMWINAVYRV